MLRQRNKAFEENRCLFPFFLFSKSVEEFAVDSSNKTLGRSSYMVHVHRCGDKLLISGNSLASGLEKCLLAALH